MKFTRSQKEFAKKVIAIVLAFGAIIGCVSLVSGLGEDDDGYTTIHPTYTVGALDKETGRPVEDDCAIYTKDLIECTGFKLYADFDSDIKYVVHFYDDNETWLACVENEGLNMAQEGLDLASEVLEDGQEIAGIRICIYPQNDENDKVSFFEKNTYGNQLTVKITTEETKVDDSKN